MTPNRIKAYTAFVNAKSMQGKVTEFDPPELKEKSMSFRAGEMLGEVDVNMGMEKMEASITFEEVVNDVLLQFGICNGTAVRLRVTASEESESCDFNQREWICVGRWTSVKTGNLKAGDATKFVCKIAINEYSELFNGKELQYIDMARGIHRVNGEDITAKRRQALDLSY